MNFVIRDDDLNYFSSPADIERWYADLFAQGVPVSFSAIPYVKPESDVYTGGASYESREYAISDNAALVRYVQGQPLADILQHGTTHETVDGVFEYAGKVARTEALRGREELERAFGRQVSVFVPPHDWIGVAGIRAVEVARMDVLRGRGAGLRNIILRFEYVVNFVKMLFFKAFNLLTSGRVPAYPHVLDFGKHREACSYRLEDKDVFKGLKDAHKHNGNFIVVVHLHFYDEEKKARLLQLIERGRSLGVTFVRASDLFTKPS